MQQRRDREREAQEIQWYKAREIHSDSPFCEWRDMADKRRQEFIECSKQDRVRLVFLFEIYRKYMLKLAYRQEFKGSSFLKKQDKKLVLELINDSSELCYIRAMATDIWSLRQYCDFEYEHAVQLLVKSASLCKGAPESEREIDLGVLKGVTGKTTVGDLLHIFTLASGASLFMSRDGALGPGPSLITGGFQCDNCKRAMEDHFEQMWSCTRCKKSYYCSSQCQNQDWAEHKKLCRKKGEFKVGDHAIYSGVDDGAMEGILRGVIVRVLAPALFVGDNKDRPKAWHARVLMTEKQCCIQVEDLKFLRPALQNRAAKIERGCYFERYGLVDFGIQEFIDLCGNSLGLDHSGELDRFWVPNNWWYEKQLQERTQTPTA